MSKHDTVPLIAKRLETKETTDQLLAAFRVFDKQNRGAAGEIVQRLVAPLKLQSFPSSACPFQVGHSRAVLIVV